MDSNPVAMHPPQDPVIRDAAPMQKQEKPRRRWCGHSSSETPWIKGLMCVLLVIAALVIWGVYTSKLAYTLVGLITHLRLGVLAQRRVESALRMLQGATLAVSCAVIGLVVAVGLTKAVFEHKRPVAGDAKKHGRGGLWTRWSAYRAAKVVVLVLLWLLVAGLIFIGMLFFTSGAALYAAEQGTMAVQSTIQQLGVKTNALLDNAEDLIADMSNTFIQWGERAPEDIQKTSWFQNLQESMGPKLQAARNLTQQPSAQECPATCLDVRVMTVWLEKEGVESCVCGQDKLQRLANLLQTGWHQAAVAWCALMVLIAACSWLHMLGVAGYTRDGMHREAYRNNNSKAAAGALPCDDPNAAAQHTNKDAAPYSKQYSAGPGRAQPYDTGVHDGMDGRGLQDQHTATPAQRHPAAAAADVEQGKL